MTEQTAQSGKRTPGDWALFALLSLMWAGAYQLTRIAVDKGNPDAGLPAAWVLAGRLTIGAAVLWVIMIAMKQRLPSLRDGKRWRTIVLMGLTSSTFPFFLITTAQKTVNSSLAALYTAAVPLFVAVGAHFLFRDERMTAGSALGVLMGFAGVAILFGPDALSGLDSASTIAQLMLIAATIFYALSSLLARGAPPMPSIVFATGFVSVAATVTWPLAFTVDPATVHANWTHWAGVIGLGIIPSAIAQALYMLLIARTSATFLSLTGYSIPVMAAVLGFFLFRETQTWHAMIAFALILSGVWLARHGGGDKTS
ncbi:MAG: DMT family transporter [Rhodobacterales bacterium]|nr:DMT family transporter [Rhodobacterales bacterium]